MSSEFSFIQQIRHRAAQPAADLVLGIGDDAAIMSERPGRERLITTDLLIEGVHFKLAYTPLHCLGHKTLAVSLSDIAAMGGKPEFALLTLGIPRFQISDLAWQSFFAGYFALAEKYGVALIGGDTSSAPGKLVIDSIVLGSCAMGKAVRRSAAQVGDAIYVTGNLGASATGLELLFRGERFDEAANNLRQAALCAHLMPEPRITFGQKIGGAGLAHAMMDVSDGLAQDLAHICAESRVEAMIEFDAVPIADCVRLITSVKEEAFSLAISGGEDYELLFTASRQAEPALFNFAAECELNLTRIGEIIAPTASSKEPRLYLRREARVDLLKVKGYDHFHS